MVRNLHFGLILRRIIEHIFILGLLKKKFKHVGSIFSKTSQTLQGGGLFFNPPFFFALKFFLFIQSPWFFFPEILEDLRKLLNTHMMGFRPTKNFLRRSEVEKCPFLKTIININEISKFSSATLFGHTFPQTLSIK